MRKRLEIPNAGKKKRVNISGRSLVVETMATYTEASQVPEFKFSPDGNRYPLYPRSTYQAVNRFDTIELYGTSESAGDIIRLITVPDCLRTELNILHTTTELVEVADTSEKVLENNTAFAFLPTQKIIEYNLAKSVDCYVAGGDLLMAYGSVDPDNSTGFGKRIEAGTHFKINGQSRLDNVSFVNADPGVKSTLIFEFDY